MIMRFGTFARSARSACRTVLERGMAAIGYQNQTIRVVVYRSDSAWLAQCLEYDIAVQAERSEDLRDMLIRTIESHIEICLMDGRKPFVALGSAPAVFFEMYESAQRHHANNDVVSFTDNHCPAAQMKFAYA